MNSLGLLDLREHQGHYLRQTGFHLYVYNRQTDVGVCSCISYFGNRPAYFLFDPFLFVKFRMFGFFFRCFPLSWKLLSFSVRLG